jgi:hypothetical protein
MFVWREDESKTPKCEGCLDKEKTSQTPSQKTDQEASQDSTQKSQSIEVVCEGCGFTTLPNEEGPWCDACLPKVIRCDECNGQMLLDGHRTYGIDCGWFCKGCLEDIHAPSCKTCNPSTSDDDQTNSEATKSTLNSQETDAIQTPKE